MTEINYSNGEKVEEKRVRIQDIAEELGLSTATVSNVIHGKTKKISEETVKRVQALLEERQYIPSMAGILLAQNASKIIGVFINDHEKYQGHTLEDVFISSSLNYLSTQIEEQGEFMMVKKAKKPEEILKFASMWNMDGLVVIGFCHQDYMYLRNHMHIPFVVYDGYCEKPERIVNITLDNYDGGYQVGSLFNRLGHKRAVCISDNEIGIDKDRMEGFERGFASGEVERIIIPMQKERRLEFYREKKGLFRQVSAAFAVSDYYAIDFMQFLLQEGFSLPEDISVAGFDGIPLGEMISPGLTTVKQDGALRARIAIQKLQELRNGQNTETTITLPVTLLERASVKNCLL